MVDQDGIRGQDDVGVHRSCTSLKKIKVSPDPQILCPLSVHNPTLRFLSHLLGADIHRLPKPGIPCKP